MTLIVVVWVVVWWGTCKALASSFHEYWAIAENPETGGGVEYQPKILNKKMPTLLISSFENLLL